MPEAFLAMITPLTGGPHPDHSLPSGGHPSQPIYHPGHPDHGRPVDPGFGVGLPVPPDAINPPLPEPPPAYANQIIVAVHRPGEAWVVKAYDPSLRPDNTLPPYAQPKG